MNKRGVETEMNPSSLESDHGVTDGFRVVVNQMPLRSITQTCIWKGTALVTRLTPTTTTSTKFNHIRIHIWRETKLDTRPATLLATITLQLLYLTTIART